MKTICVDNWDTNGDGELSYAEAAAVTDLSQVFKDKNEITSFNELQYFTRLTEIGNYAFAGCVNLQEITLPPQITRIGNQAFGCSLNDSGQLIPCSNLHYIVIPEGVTEIDAYAFSYSGLESINLPNSVTTIGTLAFGHCNLTSVYLPASVTDIDDNPFAGCDLSFIMVDPDNTVFDSRDNCNAIIETATNTLVTGCKNTVIPEGVISIGASAFEWATGLTTITLPASVASIGNYAFMRCTSLTAIHLEGYTPPTISSSTFSWVSNDITVYVPCGSVGTYQNYNNTGQPWGGFANIAGEDCETTYTLASGWNWWAPFEGNTADELMQAFGNSSFVGDILINSQDEGFLRRIDDEWDGTLSDIVVGKMYKVWTAEGGSLTYYGLRPATVTVTLEPGYTWFGFIGTEGTSITTLLTPAAGDQLIRLIGGSYTTYTYNGQVWSDGTLTYPNLTLQRGYGYIYYNNTMETKTMNMQQ